MRKSMAAPSLCFLTSARERAKGGREGGREGRRERLIVYLLLCFYYQPRCTNKNKTEKSSQMS